MGNLNLGNQDFYKFFYAGEQDAEAEAFMVEKGWKKFWGSDLEGLNGDTWVVYRDVNDLPAWLQEYARFVEGFEDNPERYYEPELGLEGTADELFVQARNGYIEEPAALAKLQEIFASPREKKLDKAFYVEVLKEIAEDSGEKPYVLGQLKKDALDNVPSEQVELRKDLLMDVFRQGEYVVVELNNLSTLAEGEAIISVEKFLTMTADEFEEMVGAAYYYNMESSEVAFETGLEDKGRDVDDCWEEMASKSVYDSDGFLTDYTLYYNPVLETYVCMFGDKDFYEPSEGEADMQFDFEAEAWEWFNNYKGFEELNDVLEEATVRSALSEEVSGSEREEPLLGSR